MKLELRVLAMVTVDVDDALGAEAYDTQSNPRGELGPAVELALMALPPEQLHVTQVYRAPDRA